MIKALVKLTALFGAVLLMTSCQKELSGLENPDLSGTDSITGSWNFVTMNVKSNTTLSGTIAGTSAKSVIVVDFISIRNAGTLKIDTSQLILTDLSYSIDTLSTTSTYVAGFLVDTSKDTVRYESPVINSATQYKLIGSDSIYFPNADFINIPEDFQMPPINGMKYKREGDLLKFTTSVSANGTDNSSGTDINYATSAAIIITFKKQ